jgi:tellurite resistance protein TerC
LGALVFRLGFILLGLELLHRFEWMYGVFGAFLCISAFLLCQKKKKQKKEGKWIQKILRVYPGPHEGRFFLFIKRKWHVTTLFAALLLIEFSDVVFAIDSIPAVLSVTSDPFIAYTSNVFAVLGLRSLFVLIKQWKVSQESLRPALACILFFIGIKMGLSMVFSIPIEAFLLGVVAILCFFFLKKKRDKTA